MDGNEPREADRRSAITKIGPYNASGVRQRSAKARAEWAAKRGKKGKAKLGKPLRKVQFVLLVFILAFGGAILMWVLR